MVTTSEMANLPPGFNTRNDSRKPALFPEKGSTDAEILTVNIELDCLINEYQRMTDFFNARTEKYLTTIRKS